MGFLSKHFVPAALLAVPAMVFGMTSTEEFSRGEGFDDFDALELRQFNVPNGPTWHPNTWKLNKPGKEEKKTKAADRGAKRPRDIVADSLEERQFTKPDGTIWYGNDFPPKKGEKKGAAGADNRPREYLEEYLEQRQFTKPDGTICPFPPPKPDPKKSAPAKRPREFDEWAFDTIERAVEEYYDEL